MANLNYWSRDENDVRSNARWSDCWDLRCYHCNYHNNSLKNDILMQFTQKNIQLANQIVEKAINNKTILVTAESCTGGLISSHLTAIPGSSKVFTCSFITYSDNSKIQLLGVNKNTIEEDIIIHINGIKNGKKILHTTFFCFFSQYHYYSL